MFVVSMKTTKSRLVVTLAVVGLLVVTLAVLWGRDNHYYSAVAVSDEASRIAYLNGLGYEVLPEQVSVREITVPVTFDEAYMAYNALQQEVGMDLMPYAGRRVKMWSYPVTNYPGNEQVIATLYVYKEKVIAGDISSAGADGFSHGLKPMTMS